MFEDKDLAEQAARVTEKQLHGEGSVSELKGETGTVRIEDKSAV